MPTRSLLFAIWLSVSLSLVAVAREPEFTVIRTADGDALFLNGVSGDGSTAVGTLFVGFGANVPVRWTAAGGIEVLNLPPDYPGGTAYAATADGGGIIVGALNTRDGTGHSFLYHGPDDVVDLGDLPGGTFETSARAVSADGSVVVGFGVSAESDPAVEAFRWTADAGIQPLGVLGGRSHYSAAADISADGTVAVGKSWGQEAIEAVRWTPQRGIESLGTQPGWTRNTAMAVSPDGQTIAGFALGSDPRTWIWTESSGYVFLPNPWQQDGGILIPTGLTDNAQVIVGVVQGVFPGPQAFIWTPREGMRDLREALETDYGFDLSGWWSFQAVDLSYDGRTIVGFGDLFVSPGHTEPQGWMAFLGDPVGCTGDLDFDGQVTLGDLSRLLTNLGTPGGATFADGDLDGDGDVDPADLARMLSAFGSRCP